MGYVFDVEQLHEIAKKGVGLPPQEMATTVLEELARTFPGSIETKQNWIFSLFGGSYGMLTLVHGSLTEYMSIYGSAIGTEGFSGRFLLDIYDFVMAGEMKNSREENCFEAEITRPGELAVLPKGRVKGFHLAPGTWMLEYGRGLIPSSIPFALGDAIFSAMDWPTIFKTLKLYGKLLTRELAQGKI